MTNLADVTDSLQQWLGTADPDATCALLLKATDLAVLRGVLAFVETLGAGVAAPIVEDPGYTALRDKILDVLKQGGYIEPV